MAETPKTTYPVLSPLDHDGKRYAPDDKRANSIELTEAEAEALRPLGVIGDPAPAKGGKTKE